MESCCYSIFSRSFLLTLTAAGDRKYQVRSRPGLEVSVSQYGKQRKYLISNF